MSPPQRRGYRWAEMMQRVFAVDVLECGHCGGRRKVLQFLTDPNVIGRILRHLGLATVHSYCTSFLLACHATLKV